MEAEIRKLQKLGSGSIVVTLPKHWAQRLGLEPGRNVMLVNEDDAIRILPLEKSEIGECTLDLKNTNPHLALGVPICTYLSGLKRVTVKLPPGGEDLVLPLVERSMNFVGLQVYHQSPGEIRIEVLLDHDKIDHIKLIRNMGSVLQALTKQIAEALETGKTNMEKAKIYRRELLRELYMAIRYVLSTHKQVQNIVTKELTALTASYLGLVVDLLYETLETITNTSLPITENDKQKIARIYHTLSDTSLLFILTIANPTQSKVTKLTQSIHHIKNTTQQTIDTLESPMGGLLAGRLQDVIRVLTLATYILICRTLLEQKKKND